MMTLPLLKGALTPTSWKANGIRTRVLADLSRRIENDLNTWHDPLAVDRLIVARIELEAIREPNWWIANSENLCALDSIEAALGKKDGGSR